MLIESPAARALRHAGLFVLVLASAPLGADQPFSDGPVAVAEVPAGDWFRLADGRAVRLAAIRVPSVEDAPALARQAAAELGALLDGWRVRLAPTEVPYDRYGRLVAQVTREDGVWLQGALLQAGLAQVQTRPGETARAAEMLALERAVRDARRGLWADPAFQVREASNAAGDVGRFGIVRGRVARVAPTESYVYLNFGVDWRRDFTVRIDKALARSLARSDLDPASLAGRRIEVRGFLLEAGGPLIELSHPEQMQLLP